MIDLIELQAALEKHGSKRGAIVELGFAYGNSTALKKVSRLIEEHNLSHLLMFKNTKGKGTDWSAENLTTLVALYKTYTDVLHHLGLPPRGRNVNTLKEKLEKYNISVAHFDRYSKHFKPNDDVFVIDKKMRNVTVKKKFLKLVPYKCSIPGCIVEKEWLGRPIRLELDHINGVSYDHRLENLRLICANCHTQTETYGNH